MSRWPSDLSAWTVLLSLNFKSSDILRHRSMPVPSESSVSVSEEDEKKENHWETASKGKKKEIDQPSFLW